MLKQLISDNLIQAHGIIGFWPANQVAPQHIQVFADNTRTQPVQDLFHLRQQMDKPNGQANFCLADYIAPAPVEDYIGGFVVTAGGGIEKLVKQYEAAGDDYNAILVKSLADRLAEAFAERLHERVRKEFWGYDAAESLDNVALIKEQYRGIRPAPGYPACPDHTEKATLFQMLDAENKIGVSLTEHFAMLPAASVSGFYFSHPDSRYFGIGKINRDQVEAYADLKDWSRQETERWLAPVIDY